MHFLLGALEQLELKEFCQNLKFSRAASYNCLAKFALPGFPPGKSREDRAMSYEKRENHQRNCVTGKFGIHLSDFSAVLSKSLHILLYRF